MDDRVREKIEQLHENEAKALLKIIYGFVVTAKTGKGGEEMLKECLEGIFNCYEKIPDVEK
jgi:hypothetical protein